MTNTMKTFDTMSHEEKDNLYGQVITDFGKHFTPNFPALIWNVIYEGDYKDTTTCFFPCEEDDTVHLGVMTKGEKGYIDMDVDFVNQLDDFDMIAIINPINELLFGLTPLEVFELASFCMMAEGESTDDFMDRVEEDLKGGDK